MLETASSWRRTSTVSTSCSSTAWISSILSWNRVSRRKEKEKKRKQKRRNRREDRREETEEKTEELSLGSLGPTSTWAQAQCPAHPVPRALRALNPVPRALRALTRPNLHVGAGSLAVPGSPRSKSTKSSHSAQPPRGRRLSARLTPFQRLSFFDYTCILLFGTMIYRVLRTLSWQR